MVQAFPPVGVVMDIGARLLVGQVGRRAIGGRLDLSLAARSDCILMRAVPRSLRLEWRG